MHQENALLQEINQVLDQLILYAELSCRQESLNQTEIALLQKTQASLLAKFWHIQEYLEYPCLKDQEHCLQAAEKIKRLRILSPSLLANFSKELTKNPSMKRN